MLPSNKIKEISSKIHTRIGDNDGNLPIKPILVVLTIIGLLYLMVIYL